MTIDFQGLLNVVKAAEAEPHLMMEAWKNELNPCGTSHCMIGAYCDQNRTDELKIVRLSYPGYWQPQFEDHVHIDAIAERFNISVRESEWLFAVTWGRWWRCPSASTLSKDQAISRLRKFIYYKMHKNEMTYEEARHIDGNKAAVKCLHQLA